MTIRTRRRLLFGIGGLIGVLAIVSMATVASAPRNHGPDAAPIPATPTASPSASTPAPVATHLPEVAPSAEETDGRKVLDVLATLPVKGRAAKTGYAREQFGQRWLDVDRNGCDTRTIYSAQRAKVIIGA